MEGKEEDGIQVSNWRVKVFLMNEEGSWDDSGTGTLRIQKIVNFRLQSQDTDYFLMVESESSEDELINSKIKLDSIYQRQRGLAKKFKLKLETIITWTEEDINNDIALSFQDLEAAQETWELLCLIQGKDPSQCNTNSNQNEGEGDSGTQDLLPQVSFHTLPLIVEELNGVSFIIYYCRYFPLIRKTKLL